MVRQVELGSEVTVADDRESWPAGRSAKGEFHCADCGYGVTVYRTLPTCPMCGGHVWDQSAWSPFGRLSVDAER